jgi:hypothetical protein
VNLTARTAKYPATPTRIVGRKGVEQLVRDQNRRNDQKGGRKKRKEKIEGIEIKTMIEGGNDDTAETVEAHDGHLPRNIEPTVLKGTRLITIHQAMTHPYQVHLLTWRIRHLGYRRPAGS